MFKSCLNLFKKTATDTAERYGGDVAGDVVEGVFDHVAGGEQQDGQGGMVGDLLAAFTDRQQGGISNLMGLVGGNMDGLEGRASGKGVDPSLISGLLSLVSGKSGGDGGGLNLGGLLSAALSLTKGGGADGFMKLLQGQEDGGSSNGLIKILVGLGKSYFAIHSGKNSNLQKWEAAGAAGGDEGNFLSWAFHLLMDLLFPGKKPKEVVDDGEDPTVKPTDPDGIKGWYDGHPEIGKMQKDIFDDVLDITDDDDEDRKGPGKDEIPLIPLPSGIEEGGSILDQASILFLNTNILLELRKEWRFLYSTSTCERNIDLFFDRIEYQGPTLLIIRTGEGHLLGGFASTSWCDTEGGWCGNGDSYIFSIKPKMACYYSAGKDDHFLHFGRGTGLGMGGRIGHFALGVDPSLSTLTYNEDVDTFDVPSSGLFGGGHEYEIDHLEIWGLGVEPDRDAECSKTQIRKPNVQIRQGNVDMNDLLDQIS